MDLTKLSTKGQVVIPEGLREDLPVGEAFVVVRKGDLIILKKVDGLTNREYAELEELQKIWKDIDAGRGKTFTKNDFLKELESW